MRSFIMFLYLLSMVFVQSACTSSNNLPVITIKGHEIVQHPNLTSNEPDSQSSFFDGLQPTDTYTDHNDPNCSPFTVIDSQGTHIQVDSYLKFSLNPDSPTGQISYGDQTVFILDSSAQCEDIAISSIYFRMVGNSGPDDCNEWLKYVPNEITITHYNSQDCALINSGCNTNQTELYWQCIFTDEQVVVTKDQILTMHVTVDITDLLVSGSPFRFDAVPFYSWYEINDPDAYPNKMVADVVFGHTLNTDK